MAISPTTDAVRRAAWLLGLPALVALAMTPLLMPSANQLDWNLLAALLVSGTLLDWLPRRWIREGDTWVRQAGSPAWTATALATVVAPVFVLICLVGRVLQMALLTTVGDGVSRVSLTLDKTIVNVSLVVLPAVAAAATAAIVPLSALSAGILGSIVMGLASNALTAAITAPPRGLSAATRFRDFMERSAPDLLAGAIVAVPLVVAIAALGPWLPLMALSGVWVLLWRQAVRLHHHTSISTSLMELTTAAAQVESVDQLRQAVQRTSLQLLGRDMQLMAVGSDNRDMTPVAVAPVESVPGWELRLGDGPFGTSFDRGPYERRALEGLAATAGMALEALHARQRLRDEATKDPLTGLLNSRGFSAEAARVLQRNAIEGTPTTVAYIDLDGLKRINDTYGHDAGDAAIKAVGDALLHHLRPGDIIGRLHGDEFAVLFSEAMDDDAADKRINDALADLPHDARASVGISTSRAGDLDALVAAADEAMYRTKHERRQARGS